MLQGFDATTRPSDGPPRLAALRARLAEIGLDGFLVPRADAHQGEYVAPHDERLAWLTGFTGSAGFCAVLPHMAGVFIDGRYRVQVKDQVDLDHFTPVPWPQTKLADWLAAQMPNGAVIGYDPWLHSLAQIEGLEAKGEDHGISYRPVENCVDHVWEGQPAPPMGALRIHPVELAGETHAAKRARLAAELVAAGETAAILTLPDSIAWLLNIRGSDVVRNPVPHAFAVLHADASVDLYVAAAKLSEPVRAHLGDAVRCHPPEAFAPALAALEGRVRIDRDSAPVRVARALARPVPGRDPCLLPKARKTAAEIEGMEQAHLRDGAAMARFLAWLDTQDGPLTEIGVVRQLEEIRRQDPRLLDISFDTIAGLGPHGAVVHYRVTEGTNRTARPGDLLLVDSGGQYADGTTDITRTLPVGPVTEDQRACFTRVLKGLIAMSALRWPRGLAGRDIDAVARQALWEAGLDYDHGTGHGVGAALCVHEGPQRLSRVSDVPLEPGMVLSIEPGCYREGAFGIRIENLVHVVEAPALPGGDDRPMLAFATLTWAPIDRRLVVPEMLSTAERGWLDRYHAGVRGRIAPLLDAATASWLDRATAPL